MHLPADNIGLTSGRLVGRDRLAGRPVVRSCPRERSFMRADRIPPPNRSALQKKSRLIPALQARVSCPHPLPAVPLMIYLMRHLGGLSHTRAL